jgi:hypothetical protein
VQPSTQSYTSLSTMLQGDIPASKQASKQTNKQIILGKTLQGVEGYSGKDKVYKLPYKVLRAIVTRNLVDMVLNQSFEGGLKPTCDRHIQTRQLKPGLYPP